MVTRGMGDSNWMTTGVSGVGVAEAARQIECPPKISTADRTGSQISTVFMIDGHRRGAEVPQGRIIVNGGDRRLGRYRSGEGENVHDPHGARASRIYLGVS